MPHNGKDDALLSKGLSGEEGEGQVQRQIEAVRQERDALIEERRQVLFDQALRALLDRNDAFGTATSARFVFEALGHDIDFELSADKKSGRLITKTPSVLSVDQIFQKALAGEYKFLQRSKSGQPATSQAARVKSDTEHTELLWRLFGRGSEAKFANRFCMEQPELYRQLRSEAKERGIYARPRPKKAA